MEDGGFETAGEGGGVDADIPDEMREEEKQLQKQVNWDLASDGKPDEWLCALEGKSGKLVCCQFAKTGKCSFIEKTGKCTFSHAAEDIAFWKAANQLGKDGLASEYKNSHVKFGPDKSGGASSSGPYSVPPGRIASSPTKPQGFPTSRTSRFKKGE